jgi:hypothetical protein
MGHGREAIEMNRDPMRHHRWAVMVAALLFSALPFTASAKEAPAAQKVRVYPKYYAAGGKRFVDLDTLDAWVKSTGTQALQFYTCMWTATDRLVAAIERFQHVYLDVRWIEPGTSGCPNAVPEKAARSF